MASVDGVVIHYFSARNVNRSKRYDMSVCWDLFLDLNRRRQDRTKYMKSGRWPEKRMYASCHLLIGRNGHIWQLAQYDAKCWHAGASVMNGRDNCNAWTIGIELIGDMHSGFTDQQYKALVSEVVKLQQRFKFPRENVQGHDTVRWNAIQSGSKTRKYKYDPSGYKDGTGGNFNWDRFLSDWDDAKNQNEALP